jgi:hypothetical protein
MGGGTSSSASSVAKSSAAHLYKSQADIVNLMLPLYFTVSNVDSDELLMASESWRTILQDESPDYISKKTSPDFHYSSCVVYFYDSFYTRLFDIHPMAKMLFKNGMKSQGNFLVKMISLALSELEDKSRFDKTLVKLAEIHNQRGVKAVECISLLICIHLNSNL